MTRPAAIATVLAVALGAAGCTASTDPGAGAKGSSVASPGATRSADTGAAGSVRPSLVPAGSVRPSLVPAGSATLVPPTTTMTTWGRIWDALPPTFPSFPGAEPAATSEGPASGVLSANGKTAPIVAFYQGALRDAGYDNETLAGPMEDGSTTIDAVGAKPGCRAQITVVPRGGLALVTIMFAAACPYR